MNKKIVFIGGHHTPGVSVIEELRNILKDRGVDVEFIWVGHKYSMWGDKNVSAEYKDVNSLGITFFDLKAGKFYRTFNPLKLIRIPWGFIKSFYFLQKIRPDLIVSFGGYLAVPVVFTGWLLQIPSVTHEQTTVAGLASRVISIFSKKIFVSFENSKKYFPVEKTEYVGNPIRKNIFIDGGLFKFKREKRVIYITGGKQGAHVINSVVATILPKLLEEFNVIHQSGSSTIYNDSVKLQNIRNTLSYGTKEYYVLREYFDNKEVGSVFSRANIIISRSGANIVYEIGALGIPSVLIPISWSSHGEQLNNARFLESGGGCKVIEECNLNSENLLSSLREINSNYENYRLRSKAFSSKFEKDSAKILANKIFNLVTY